ERKSNLGCRNMYCRSIGAVFRPNPKTVVTTLACRASITSCFRSIAHDSKSLPFRCERLHITVTECGDPYDPQASESAQTAENASSELERARDVPGTMVQPQCVLLTENGPWVFLRSLVLESLPFWFLPMAFSSPLNSR